VESAGGLAIALERCHARLGVVDVAGLEGDFAGLGSAIGCSRTLVERRLLAGPGFVALQDDDVVGPPFLQLEGAAEGLGRIHAETAAAGFFHRRLGDDMADAIGQGDGPQGLECLFQHDDAGEPVFDLDMAQRPPVAGDRGFDLGVDDALIGVLDVLSRDVAEIAAPAQAVLELEADMGVVDLLDRFGLFELPFPAGRCWACSRRAWGRSAP
jgi:hypothetical protein